MIKRREELGLRQEDAAQRVGCCPGTWGRWESPYRLPKPGAWLKIAKALGLTLEQLQRAGGNTLLAISDGHAKQPGPAPGDAKVPVAPEEYRYLSGEAASLEHALANVDLHKLAQSGWHFHMGNWRSNIREMLHSIDLMVRAAKGETELFLKLHNTLLGNETGRVLPMPKIKKAQHPFKPPTQSKPKGKGKKPRR